MQPVIVHFDILAMSEDEGQAILDKLKALYDEKRYHAHGWYEKTNCKFKIVCDQDPNDFEVLPDACTMMEAYDQGLDALGHSLVAIEPGADDYDDDSNS